MHTRTNRYDCSNSSSSHARDWQIIRFGKHWWFFSFLLQNYIQRNENSLQPGCILNKEFFSEFPVDYLDWLSPDEGRNIKRSKSCDNKKDENNSMHVDNDKSSVQKFRQTLYKHLVKFSVGSSSIFFFLNIYFIF